MRRGDGLISTRRCAKPLPMKHRMRITLLALVGVLTLALAATGFGHRLPTAQQAQLEIIAQMGGLAEICADLNGDGIPADECPVCHLTGGAALPPTLPAAKPADLVLLAVVLAPRESRAIRAVLDPAHGLRAPPLA